MFMNSKFFEVYMLDISIGFTLHLIWYFPLSYFSCNCAPNRSPLLLCWGSFLGYHGNTTNFIYIFSVSNWYPIIFMQNILEKTKLEKKNVFVPYHLNQWNILISIEFPYFSKAFIAAFMESTRLRFYAAVW